MMISIQDVKLYYVTKNSLARTGEDKQKLSSKQFFVSLMKFNIKYEDTLKGILLVIGIDRLTDDMKYGKTNFFCFG